MSFGRAVRRLDVPEGFQMPDLMGNLPKGKRVIPGESALYLTGK